jgi:hypothetical protein
LRGADRFRGCVLTYGRRFSDIALARWPEVRRLSSSPEVILHGAVLSFAWYRFVVLFCVQTHLARDTFDREFRTC